MTPHEARNLAAALVSAAADAESQGLDEVDLQGALSQRLASQLDSLQAAIDAANAAKRSG
jgi:hypothetical protein